MRGTSTTTGGSAEKALRPDVWSTVLTGTVLFVYLLLSSGSAVPGRSADLIVKALGLEPRLSPASSLWFTLTAPLARLPKAVLALNLFSTLCAVACVFLTGWILRQVVLVWSAEKMMPKEEGLRLSRIAALTGSAALAFSPPFWAAALRADSGTFDSLLLLIWLTFCIRFVLTLRMPWAYAAMLWAGVGASQSVAFLWLAPLALVAFFGLLNRDIRARVKALAKLAALLVLPYLLVTTLQSWLFIGTEGHRLTGNLPLLQVAIELGWGQLLLMRQGVTTEGWLLGFLVAIAPWLACTGLMIRPNRKRTSLERGTSSDRPALHTMATVASLGVFLGAPFSIWSLYGERISWLTPVVLSSLTFGWLAAYWYRFAMRLPDWRLWRKPQLLLPVRHAALALTLLFLVKGLVSNSPGDARLLRSVVATYASHIVEATGTHPWLITGGSLDSAILIDAYTKGKPLQTLNMLRMPNSLYRDYMASRFPDPQLGNACHIGMTPLVHEWFGRGTNMTGQVAVLGLPDLWYAAGLQPQPNVLVFVGDATNSASRASPEAVWILNTNGWARLDPLLTACKDDPPAVAHFRKQGRRHVSTVANNAGVWLEENGKPALAGEAYVIARHYEPYNVSALLNLGALVRSGVVTNNATAIIAELKSLVEAKPTFDWWSLTRRYGYVRQAEAYAAMGYMWALSGQSGITAAGLTRSLALSKDEKKADEHQSILAQLYAQQGKIEESRALLSQQLKETPNDIKALIGMAQLALATNDVAATGAWLQRAEKTGMLKDGLDLVAAGLYSRINDFGRARLLAQAAIDRSYDNLPAWAALAGVALGQRDAKTLELCQREIHRLEKGRGFNSVLIEALLALNKGALSQSRVLFDEALRIRPKSTEAMERILRLDLLLGLRPSTPEQARFLMTLDSYNAFAPYILGLVHVKASEWAAARPWLEKSVSLSPSPEVLNDLAWTLLQLKEFAPAEQRAREAVTRMPNFGAAWDTLGLILTHAGRHDEAATALERAITLGGRHPLLLAHLARARFGQGDIAAARLLLQEAVSVKRELTPQEDEEIRAVRQLLKGRQESQAKGEK